jgi:hypothetical protein
VLCLIGLNDIIASAVAFFLLRFSVRTAFATRDDARGLDEFAFDIGVRLEKAPAGPSFGVPTISKPARCRSAHGTEMAKLNKMTNSLSALLKSETETSCVLTGDWIYVDVSEVQRANPVIIIIMDIMALRFVFFSPPNQQTEGRNPEAAFDQSGFALVFALN